MIMTTSLEQLFSLKIFMKDDETLSWQVKTGTHSFDERLSTVSRHAEFCPSVNSANQDLEFLEMVKGF